MRQSVMMSLHANMSGSKKKFKPEDFNPFAKQTKGGTVSSKEDVTALREKILARGKPKNTTT